MVKDGLLEKYRSRGVRSIVLAARQPLQLSAMAFRACFQWPAYGRRRRHDRGRVCAYPLATRIIRLLPLAGGTSSAVSAVFWGPELSLPVCEYPINLFHSGSVPVCGKVNEYYFYIIMIYHELNLLEGKFFVMGLRNI